MATSLLNLEARRGREKGNIHRNRSAKKLMRTQKRKLTPYYNCCPRLARMRIVANDLLKSKKAIAGHPSRLKE
jgi:hypothetical protein